MHVSIIINSVPRFEERTSKKAVRHKIAGAMAGRFRFLPAEEGVLGVR